METGISVERAIALIESNTRTVAAGVRVTKRDLTRLGEGGLCLGCPVCTWPNCGFGKGN